MDSNDIKNRSFLGAVAAAIKAFCMVLVDLFSVTQEGVAMAEKAVKVARDKQAIELGISMSDYANLAVSMGAMEQVKAQEAVNEYVKADSTGARGKLINEAQTRLSGVVNSELSAIKADRESRK